ncbi:hypothetical protein DVH05_009800 [Phytophthora capsici]|nr:hypothetical protein DVH05_009799 [Phytophthora capsici]KAG1684985.1 hypothetical protein DVH05_009800 [Phytophthora capsici]
MPTTPLPPFPPRCHHRRSRRPWCCAPFSRMLRARRHVVDICGYMDEAPLTTYMCQALVLWQPSRNPPVLAAKHPDPARQCSKHTLSIANDTLVGAETREEMKTEESDLDVAQFQPKGLSTQRGRGAQRI